MADQEEIEAKRIGRLIAGLRGGKGWSQQDLAGELNMSVSTISRWERGLHEGYAPNVRKLAAALDVQPGVLRPVEPEFQTQLDRIEHRLEQIWALLAGEDCSLTPDAAADAPSLPVEIARDLPAHRRKTETRGRTGRRAGRDAR